MKELTCEADQSLDCLLEESFYFVRYFLGDEVQFKELFEEVISGFPSFTDQVLDHKKAFFFREIEKVARKQKRILSKIQFKQLELFEELSEHPSEAESYQREIGICRIRAYLLQKNLFEDLAGEDFGLIASEKAVGPFIEIASRLLTEYFFDSDDFSKRENFDRIERICLYLMELLPDSESVNVEIKCRQDPDWQRDKVELVKIAGWFEFAAQTMNDHIIPQKIGELAKLKPLLVNKFAYFEEGTSFDKGAVNHGDSTHKNVCSSNSRDHKDILLWSFLIVGFLTSFIGYFGWLERVEKFLEAKNSVEEAMSQPDAQTTLAGREDLLIEAVHHAEQVANMVLAKQTGTIIRDLEKQITVPSELLSNVKDQELDSIDTSIESFAVSSFNPVYKNFKDNVQIALSSGTGFIFRPDDEALGKVVDVCFIDSKIHFKRADWPNPNASFALSIQKYEIRMGVGDSGFLIIGGEVVRDSRTGGGDPSLPAYYLIPENAWWLDRNQSRTEFALDILQPD